MYRGLNLKKRKKTNWSTKQNKRIIFVIIQKKVIKKRELTKIFIIPLPKNHNIMIKHSSLNLLVILH